jgi:thymidylate synthase (FAD)
MTVQLIAQTVITDEIEEYNPHCWEQGVSQVDELAEMAGRLCYESWERPNPATATNEGYLRNILAQRHFSVLEHASATFFVSDVSRSFLAELSRHRHLSFSVVSQRYVDHGEKSDKWIAYPALFNGYLESRLDAHFEASQKLYDEAVFNLISQGYSRKEARGAARAFLPEATETAILVTGNMRAWRELIEKRNTEGADIEIRNVAQELLVVLKEIAPNTFQDMEV